MIDYPDFKDIQDEKLRTFNRCQTALVIHSDLGKQACDKYLSQFSTEVHKRMYLMFFEIEEFGEDEVKKQIMKGMH